MHGPESVVFLAGGLDFRLLAWSTRTWVGASLFLATFSLNCCCVSKSPEGFHHTFCHLNAGINEFIRSLDWAANRIIVAIAVAIPGKSSVIILLSSPWDCATPHVIATPAASLGLANFLSGMTMPCSFSTTKNPMSDFQSCLATALAAVNVALGGWHALPVKTATMQASSTQAIVQLRLRQFPISTVCCVVHRACCKTQMKGSIYCRRHRVTETLPTSATYLADPRLALTTTSWLVKLPLSLVLHSDLTLSGRTKGRCLSCV